MTYDVNAYFDKVFYINMPHDEQRNLSIINQFKKFNITNYERIEGISIVDLPEKIYYRNFNNYERKYVLGNLGCNASHRKAVQLAKERGYKRVFILEDDIIITQDINKLLSANEGILNDWDVLYFGGLVEYFFRNQIVCLHAYAICDKVYDDIIYMSESSGMEMDNFYAKVLQHMSYNYNQSGKFNIRMIQPFNTVIQNHNFNSNIQV